MKKFRPIDPIDTDPSMETPIENYPGYLGLFSDYQPTHLDQHIQNLNNISIEILKDNLFHFGLIESVGVEFNQCSYSYSLDKFDWPNILDNLSNAEIHQDISNNQGMASGIFHILFTKEDSGYKTAIDEINNLITVFNKILDQSENVYWLIENSFIAEPRLGGTLIGELSSQLELPNNSIFIHYSQEMYDLMMEDFFKKNGHYPDQ